MLEILKPKKAESLVQLQTRRFLEQVQDAVGSDCRLKLKFDGDRVVYAKVNTHAILNSNSMKILDYITLSWDLLDYQVSRTGPGLRIEFNPNYKSELK